MLLGEKKTNKKKPKHYDSIFGMLLALFSFLFDVGFLFLNHCNIRTVSYNCSSKDLFLFCCAVMLILEFSFLSWLSFCALAIVTLAGYCKWENEPTGW